MSGVFSRFKAVFQARANEAAEYLEDPRTSLDYSLTRLEDNRREISRSLIEVTAARQRLETQHNQLSGQIRKYQGQAEASVKSGQDEMARSVLERRQEAQTRLTELEANIASLDQQIDNLKQSQSALDRKISLFRAKKEELKSLYDSSRAQLRVREALSGISQDLADVGSTIERIEERIQMMRSRTEAINSLVSEGVLREALEPGVDDIDRRLADIERSQVIEDELARLKSESAAGQA